MVMQSSAMRLRNLFLLLSFLQFFCFTSLVLGSYSSIRFAVVDVSHGNDGTCSSLMIHDITPSTVTVVPCATINQAISMLAQFSGVDDIWIHFRGTHHVQDQPLPLSRVTLSSNLPSLVNVTYSFPSTLTTNISQATFDCMGAQYCIQSQLPGLTIDGISFRNVLLHAITHVGAPSHLVDVTLSQVDCQNSGGLLYMAHGTAIFDRVRLINAMNDPLAPGFDSTVALIHFINANISITDSEFRYNQLNASFIYPPSVMTVISQTSLTTFTMRRSVFDGNIGNEDIVRFTKSVNTCIPGPVLNFNVSDILIVVDSCDFINNVAYGASVCGGAMSVNPGADYGHVVDIQVSSTRFMNNSVASGFGITTAGQGAALMVTDAGFTLDRLAESSPSVTISNCIFTDNFSYQNGGVSVQRIRKLQISDSYFARNEGSFGSALLLADGLYASNITPVPTIIRNCTFEGNTSPSVSITSSFYISILDTTFVNSVGTEGAGGLAVLKMTEVDTMPVVTIANCLFTNNQGALGGGLSVTSGIATIINTTFSGNHAQMGGSAYFDRAIVKYSQCFFVDNYVAPKTYAYTGVYSLEGGAIYAVASQLEVDNGVFTNSSVFSDGGLEACASVMSGSTLSATWRGGAFSLRETFFTMMDSTLDGSSSCCGGDIYSDGNSAYVINVAFTNSRSYVGGSLAMKDTNTLFVSAAMFMNISAYSNGGAMVFSSVSQFEMSVSSFQNILSETGDGGVLYIAGMNVFGTNSAQMNTFTNCAAPLGGGSIVFFSSLYGGVARSFGFTDQDSNTIMPPNRTSEYVQWGLLEATNVFIIRASVGMISVYPGQRMSDSSHAPATNLTISAIDGFNQTVKGNRGMVVQVTLSQVDGQPLRLSMLSGITLQQMTSQHDAAVFDDLTLQADPGTYQLTFSVVGTPSIPTITVPIQVREACPEGFFYDSFLSYCSQCPNSLLVYDPAQEMCLPCERGRVATASGHCAICSLGATNYGSPNCVTCGSNTYQPAPLAACASCLDVGMEGLTCVGGLAQVSEGYFAFSVMHDGSSTPTLQTVQCPDGYCSGSFVQANWTDPLSEFMNGSASSVVPSFRSAVTRFDQCAYPRLASEDNYLCGACAPGLIVWGSKCSKCDHIDGGRMMLFIFLSFALVIFLVRSSLGSASAGHTTILLYFVQTSMLEIGSSSNLIGWLNLGLLSPSSFSDCVAPLDVYQQSTFQLLMPLFLLGELLVVMTLHYVWFRFRSQNGIRANPAPQSAQSLQARFLSVIDSFSTDLYVSASLSILLFTYTQVMMESFRMLSCVDVAGVSVVFTQPTMRCDSDEYKRHMILVGIVIAYVGMLPLSVSLFLWRNHTLVQMSHDLMKFEDTDIDAAMEEYQEPSVSSKDAKASVGATKPSNEDVSRFLLRYSCVFSMYSSTAWFWKGILLSRRVVFAALSVSLTRQTNMKFFAYSFTHLCSLLLQLYFEPFELGFFNAAEVGFHVVLILLSQSLTAILPPLETPIQMYLFMLVILPIGVYTLLVLVERYIHHRKRRSLDELIFARGSVASNNPHEATQTNPLHAHGAVLHAAVEMSDFQAHHKRQNGEVPGQEAANSDGRSHVLPDYVTRSESMHSDSQAL